MKVSDRVFATFVYQDPKIELTLAPVRDGIQFQLNNRTDHAEKVVWDEVAFVDFDQTSQRVAHGGIRYSDLNRSQPPSIAPPHNRLVDTVVPVNRIAAKTGNMY